MWGSKIPNVPEHNSLQFPFMNLELRREGEEEYMQVGESKVGTGLQGS